MLRRKKGSKHAEIGGEKEHCRRRTYKHRVLVTAWAWQVRAGEQGEDYLEYSRTKTVVEKQPRWVR